MTQSFLQRLSGHSTRRVRGRQYQPALVLAVAATFVPSPSVGADPDSVLESLRAADAARKSDTAEAQAWAEEEARLRLLITTIRERTTAAERRRSNSQKKLQKLVAETPEPPAVSLQTGTVRIARDIDRALDALARRVPPGLIPRRGTQRASPREALDQALHRLERAERGLGTVAVSIASGRLKGEPKSVEVLRLGGVAAWWRSLDGESGGEAQTIDGELKLHPMTDVATLEAIARASAIAKGRAAPQIVRLPVSYARTSTEATP